MSKEDVVAYTVLRFLQSRHWTVFHYHAPGGQAATHFVLADGTRVVPDIMGYRNGTVILAECKGRYAASDIEKLEAMQTDSAVRGQITALAKQHATCNGTTISDITEILFAHAFAGEAPTSPRAGIGLIAIGPRGCVSSSLPLH